MEHLKEKAIQEKIDLWFKDAYDAEDDELEQLEDFALRLTTDCKRRKHVRLTDEYLANFGITNEDLKSARAPIPGRAACTSHTRKRGGCQASLQEALGLRLSSTGYGVGPAPESLPPPDLAQLYSACEMPLTMGLEPKFRPEAIEEVGKIRVATIHDALATHYGRGVSAETIPLLARHPWFRAGLTGSKIELEPHKGDTGLLTLFSADLTAATELLTHDRAQAVMRGVGAALEWSESRIEAVETLLGPQRLIYPGNPKHGHLTTNSVLLGLGITWTVLSIVNAFNATRDGLNDRSFAVCGDDLTGLWNRAHREEYISKTEEMDLQINRSKSFTSRKLGVL